jgi:hypothetical protein
VGIGMMMGMSCEVTQTKLTTKILYAHGWQYWQPKFYAQNFCGQFSWLSIFMLELGLGGPQKNYFKISCDPFFFKLLSNHALMY